MCVCVRVHVWTKTRDVLGKFFFMPAPKLLLRIEKCSLKKSPSKGRLPWYAIFETFQKNLVNSSVI